MFLLLTQIMSENSTNIYICICIYKLKDVLIWTQTHNIQLDDMIPNRQYYFRYY